EGGRTARSYVRDFISIGLHVIAAAGNRNDGIFSYTPPAYPAALYYDDIDDGSGNIYEAQVIAVSAVDVNDEFLDGYVFSPGINPFSYSEQ
ncbi:MAG: hypothetical protein AAFP15_17865, partial [Bacteroidota bacterium]